MSTFETMRDVALKLAQGKSAAGLLPETVPSFISAGFTSARDADADLLWILGYPDCLALVDVRGRVKKVAWEQVKGAEFSFTVLQMSPGVPQGGSYMSVLLWDEDLALRKERAAQAKDRALAEQRRKILLPRWWEWPLYAMSPLTWMARGALGMIKTLQDAPGPEDYALCAHFRDERFYFLTCYFVSEVLRKRGLLDRVGICHANEYTGDVGMTPDFEKTPGVRERIHPDMLRVFALGEIG